jgi:glutamate formiminotransferase / formiminotetrahydrofolate cyclodeaminase
MRLVECVPNFSEGRDEKVLDAIADAIRGVEGVDLLDIDPGKATNRTVMTFVGPPEAVVEGAFQGISRAAALIDMRKHTGAHPRMGATDVCPFIPVSGVTMQDCVELSKKLGKRVGEELGIPVYLYAEAASCAGRVSLADIRKGEYEALAEKMREEGFRPDFGPVTFNPQAGATVIGARQFLIAYNVNLNTRSQKLANEIAFAIRESGKTKRDESGKIVRDNSGAPLMEPGTLKSCRAVGWYIDEYQRTQVSINLTDFNVTSMHVAFDECCRQAEKLGVRVTGSEIVGLVPLQPVLEAGRHYLRKQGRSTGVSEKELINVAVQSLGLSELSPFDPAQKIIEYRVAPAIKLLKDMTISDFADELASESPAPGGGSVAALCGSLSAALSAMVANLTHDKKGFEAARTAMDDIASRGQALKKAFLGLVDEDTQAFNRIIEARRMAKATDQEKQLREAAILEANKQATLVPLSVLKSTLTAAELAELVIEKGNPNSLSDGGVSASAARAAAEGAYYNVLINLSGIEDKQFSDSTREEADKLLFEVRRRCESLHETMLSKLNSGG